MPALFLTSYSVSGSAKTRADTPSPPLKTRPTNYHESSPSTCSLTAEEIGCTVFSGLSDKNYAAPTTVSRNSNTTALDHLKTKKKQADLLPVITFLLLNDADAKIALVATAARTSTSASTVVGESITYTFKVSNPGGVALKDVKIEDYRFRAPYPYVEIAFVSGDNDGDRELDVNETWTYVAEYKVTQADVDLGRIDNQARVSAIASGSEVCKTPLVWSNDGASGTIPKLQDFSNVGYMRGNVPIPERWPTTINVRTFGAKGDGEHDDTQAFRDAIAAAPPNSAVFVPNGRYKITDWVKVDDKSNFVLKGEDMYETVLWFPSTLKEVRPSGDYVHAKGGGFLYFSGGANLGLENFSLIFRDEQNGTHFNGSGANAVFTENITDGWVRNIYVKNANLGLRINGKRLTVSNIVLDHFPGRPKTDGIFPNKVGHYGITLYGATDSLVQDIAIAGEWFHDIGTHQAARDNVFSRIKSFANSTITHKSTSDRNNLYTQIDLGLGTRFSDSRDNTVYWNITADSDLPYPPTNRNSIAVGLKTNERSASGANYWYETIEPHLLCPSNLYLAQLKAAGKTVPEPQLTLPPFWLAPDPTRSNPVDDTFLNSRSETPAGSSPLLELGSNRFRTRRPYLKFDLQKSVLERADKAVLRVYKSLETDGSIDVSVKGIENDTWNENTLTFFSNHPSGATVSAGFLTISKESGWYEFDVTAFVNSQLMGDKIVSLVLEDASLQGARHSLHSKEANDLYPQLVLTPSKSAPPQPPILSDDPINGLRVTDLSGTAVDNDDPTRVILCTTCSR